MITRNPRPGQIYSNSKQQLYQIIVIAQHTETGEKLVVYQALHPDFQICAGPLSLFIREFEETSDFVQSSQEQKENKTEDNESVQQTTQICNQTCDEEPAAGNINPILLEFLDASTIHEKLEVICDNRGLIDKKCISDLAVALDITIEEDDLDRQLEELVSCLNTMKRFEVGRLR